MRQTLEGAKRPLHYLAIPPSMFGTVVQHLAAAGCAEGAKVIVEKPFGRDLQSAREPSDQSVEAAWRVIDPALMAATDASACVIEDEPGRWGRAEAEDIIEGHEGGHDPKPEAALPC
ncbi:MAG: hypothetical protein ABJA83_04880 [Burkholderiaceae bacterium]